MNIEDCDKIPIVVRIDSMAPLGFPMEWPRYPACGHLEAEPLTGR